MLASTGGTGGHDDSGDSNPCAFEDVAALCKMTPEVMRSFYAACSPYSDYTLWGSIPVYGQQRQTAINRQSPLAKVTEALQRAQECLNQESDALDAFLGTEEMAVRATLTNLADSLRSVIDVAVANAFEPLRYTQYMLGMYAGALGILLLLVVVTYS